MCAYHVSQVMDYGYPQFTEAQILQEFIKTDSYRMEVSWQQQQMQQQWQRQQDMQQWRM